MTWWLGIIDVVFRWNAACQSLSALKSSVWIAGIAIILVWCAAVALVTKE